MNSMLKTSSILTKQWHFLQKLKYDIRAPSSFSGTQFRTYCAAPKEFSSNIVNQPIHVDEKVVERTASLAGLHYEPEEMKKFIPQFGKFLQFLQEVNDVDTTDVLTEGLFDTSLLLRDDVPLFYPHVDHIKDQFPDSENGYARVPRVLNDENAN